MAHGVSHFSCVKMDLNPLVSMSTCFSTNCKKGVFVNFCRTNFVEFCRMVYYNLEKQTNTNVKKRCVVNRRRK